MKYLADWNKGTFSERRLLMRCRKEVQKIAPAADVILYGSRARGEAGIESDYDFLVLVKQKLTRKLEDSIHHTLYAIERETDTVLSVQVFEYRQWRSLRFKITPFFRNVEREGIRV